MTSICFERHVLDGPAGQKFESTWARGRLSNRAWLGGNSKAHTKEPPRRYLGYFVVHIFPSCGKTLYFACEGLSGTMAGGDHVTDSAVDIQGRHLKLSNLEKVLYPATGFTKQKVIDYYARIAPAIIPHRSEE